ncbi:MAG TPA: HhoA/HhoB/HtrA family serine endopeptidase [Halomicronema sp.]
MDSSTSKTHDSKKPSWKQSAVFLLLLFMGAGGTFLGTRLIKANPRLFSGNNAPPAQQIPLPVARQVEQQQLAEQSTSSQDSNFIVAAVEKVGPAVVRINASRTVSRNRPDVFDDPLRRFFGRGQIPPDQRVERGSGSGFIISSKGQIVTNAHVIDGADTVEVTLKDGRTFTGTVLGEDPVTDVAVVKIDSTDLPVVAFGDSTQLEPGEWAIAIGNPMGLDNTVTAGIISATERSSSQVGIPDKRVGFIQTDAAINPGNSGGPLLNAAGEVIGMNTAIISGAQGLGFAIPINTVEEISQQLIKTGSAEHPYLGIEMRTLTSELKTQINKNPNSGIRIAAQEGVLIARVVENSPADQAGIRAGDVLQKVANKPVAKAEDVQQIVQKSQIGNPLALEINRSGQLVKLQVRPGKMPMRSE